MKRRERTFLLLAFCLGLIGGVAMPRWRLLYDVGDLSVFDLQTLRDFVREGGAGVQLWEVTRIRAMSALLLFFSCYSMAGFWIFLLFCLILGWDLGLLCALSVLQLRYSGLLLLAASLFPQWIFYWCGLCRTAVFMQRRRERGLLCGGNMPLSGGRRAIRDFLGIFILTGLGIAAEFYVNPMVIQCFLSVFSERSL